VHGSQPNWIFIVVIGVLGKRSPGDDRDSENLEVSRVHILGRIVPDVDNATGAGETEEGRSLAKFAADIALVSRIVTSLSCRPEGGSVLAPAGSDVSSFFLFDEIVILGVLLGKPRRNSFEPGGRTSIGLPQVVLILDCIGSCIEGLVNIGPLGVGGISIEPGVVLAVVGVGSLLKFRLQVALGRLGWVALAEFSFDVSLGATVVRGDGNTRACRERSFTIIIEDGHTERGGAATIDSSQEGFLSLPLALFLGGGGRRP
jgi:hypothetical protein